MKENQLGTYLRDRRTKLDPASFGFSGTRRRTPGLRREEVAQRANMSATWYTWLEQGRGGAPSEDMLDRIALALMMTEAEREHLFLLALGRPPAARAQVSTGITPRLQRLLDSLDFSPAMIRSSTWDVLAWNKAACVILVPFDKLPPDQRNSIKLIFLRPEARKAQADWEGVARFVVSTFRADAARAGLDVTDFVAEMCSLSPDFERIWLEHEVAGHYAEYIKKINHQTAGELQFECSSFAVDGRPDLSMTIYLPASQETKDKIQSLLESSAVPNGETHIAISHSSSLSQMNP